MLHEVFRRCNLAVGDYAAARVFLERTIDLHVVSEKITLDKSEANMAAIEGIRGDSGAYIGLR